MSAQRFRFPQAQRPSARCRSLRCKARAVHGLTVLLLTAVAFIGPRRCRGSERLRLQGGPLAAVSERGARDRLRLDQRGPAGAGRLDRLRDLRMGRPGLVRLRPRVRRGSGTRTRRCPRHQLRKPVPGYRKIDGRSGILARRSDEDGPGGHRCRGRLVLAQFDKIVYSITAGMRAVYWTWLGVALAVVSVLVLWNALKADSAGVTRTSAVAALGLDARALLIGAPQKALQISDDTFGLLVTETQDQIFSVRFGGGEGNGTLASGGTNPRDVLLDQIFLEDWRKGWFGTTTTRPIPPSSARGCAIRWRSPTPSSSKSRAIRRLRHNSPRTRPTSSRKSSPPEEDYQLSYYQFQGKTPVAPAPGSWPCSNWRCPRCCGSARRS